LYLPVFVKIILYITVIDNCQFLWGRLRPLC